MADNFNIIILLGTFVLVVALLWFLITPPKSCDLDNPTNRTFESYYGIKKNYFNQVNAERDENPFFEGVVPDNLFFKNSLILVAKRGGGKTAIRRRYAEKKPIKIEFYNKQANHIFKNFVNNMKASKQIKSLIKDHEYINNFWKAEDFEDSILYLFVESLLTNYTRDKSTFTTIFKNLKNQDEKLQLSLILCLYASHGKIITLEDFLDEMWMGNNWVAKKIPKSSFEETDRITGRTSLKRLFSDLEALQDKISIIERSKDLVHRKSLELLFNLMEHFKYSSIYFSKNDKISILTDFYKHNFKFTPCIIVDSMDEVNYFFDDKKVNHEALKKFIQSSLNHLILAKAFDGSLDLVYMFPLLPNIDIKNFIERRDKIPLVTLEWSENQLKNYADFLLREMQVRQRGHCHTLPDFHTLVKYEENKELIKTITTPREINIFMEELIILLNGDCYKNKFGVTQENAKKALEKTKVRMNE